MSISMNYSKRKRKEKAFHLPLGQAIWKSSSLKRVHKTSSPAGILPDQVVLQGNWEPATSLVSVWVLTGFILGHQWIKKNN